VERDGSEYYTLAYRPANPSYNGSFRRIKVTLDNTNYRLRYREGYWAIPPGRDVLITPAAAQLLAEIESGTHKASFAPEVNAALVQARDGRFDATVAVSMPGSLVPFARQKDSYQTDVTLLLVARDPQGQLVAIYERYGNLRFNTKDREEFKKKVFNLQGHIPVPSLDAISVQAIVEFSGGSVGISERLPVDAGPASAGPRLTNVVLSNRIEAANCADDPTDSLCIRKLRLILPSQAQFLSSDKLMVCFAALGLEVDGQTKLPSIGVSFELESGGERTPLPPARIQAVPGNTADSLVVLGEFNLKDLRPGKYRLHAKAEDSVRHAASEGLVGFVVE
jgi:hypothetical protein